MYEIFKSVITSKSYNLEQMIKKLIPDGQKILLPKNREKNSLRWLKPMQIQASQTLHSRSRLKRSPKKQIALEDTVEKLSATVQKIKETVESGGTVVPDPEPPVTEEYPAWEPYNGIPPVPYQVGSKVTHNGKKWESMVPNNVWEPGAFGVDQNIWKEVV